MANILNSNNGVSKIVAVLILVIMTVMVLFPMADEMGKPVEKTYTYTITNSGVPFAIADAGVHTLAVSMNGDAFTVTSDGTSVNTAGLGTYQSVSVENATSSIVLAVGTDAVLKLYDSGDVMLHVPSGSVNLGKASDTVTVTVSNGTVSYTGGSATVKLYRASAGDYVLANAPVKVLDDATVYLGQYDYDTATADGNVDIGYACGFIASMLTADVTTVTPVSVLAPSDAPASVDMTVNSTSDSYITISSVVAQNTYSDSDSSSLAIKQILVPATATYDETVTEPAGGLVYELVRYLPLIIIICLFVSFVVPMAKR